jgi:hypothetical protein
MFFTDADFRFTEAQNKTAAGADARENDALRSREICAGIRSGEIVIFDNAYLDFLHLFDRWDLASSRVSQESEHPWGTATFTAPQELPRKSLNLALANPTRPAM